jgi:MFS family permease
MVVRGRDLFTAFVIMLGQMTFGTVMIYPSPAEEKIRRIHHMKDLVWSGYSGVCSLFAIAGSLLCRPCLRACENSRRRCVFFNALVGTIFWLLNTLVEMDMIYGYVARAALGFVIGLYSSLSPMFMVEVAPPGHSAFFGCMSQFGITFGIVAFQFLGAAVGFQFLNFLGAGICALQASLVYLIDESPAMAQNNAAPEAKAPSIFQWQHATGLFIGAFGMFLQQFSGINAILTNLATIMSDSGLNLDRNIQAGIATLAQLFSIFIGSLIMDRIGRKVCWTISCSMMALFLLLFGLNGLYKWTTWLPMVCIFLYRLGFGLGLAPIPWFICSEIFDDSLRAQASSVVGVSNWTFAFITIFLWPVIRDSPLLQPKPYGSMFLFTVICAIAIAFGLYFIPDPKKKEEIPSIVASTTDVLYTNNEDI